MFRNSKKNIEPIFDIILGSWLWYNHTLKMCYLHHKSKESFPRQAGGLLISMRGFRSPTSAAEASSESPGSPQHLRIHSHHICSFSSQVSPVKMRIQGNPRTPRLSECAAQTSTYFFGFTWSGIYMVSANIGLPVFVFIIIHYQQVYSPVQNEEAWLDSQPFESRRAHNVSILLIDG